MNAIDVAGVSKDFPSGWMGARHRALDNVTLHVRQGAVVGLLGPNGSGKSTLLKIVLGLLAPSAGECRVFGVPSRRIEARTAVGYLPEAPGFDPQMTAGELVWYHARLSGLPRAGLQARVDRAIDGVGLAAARNCRVVSFSQGMRQRLGLAQALVHDPRLLVLDEPMAGLDPVGVAETGRLITRLKSEGRTVLFTSHLLGQVAEICDEVALLSQGRLVLEGPVGELIQRGDRTALVVDHLPEATLDDLHLWLRERGIQLHAAGSARDELERIFLDAVRLEGGCRGSGS